jgi:nucleoside-diphosphate-sugar epimerase
MKILIIGGTGNISRWIVPAIHNAENNIYLFNRGSSPFPEQRGLHQIIGDRTKYGAFKRQIEALGHFDCVIDMVAYEPEDVLSAIECFSGKTSQYILCSTIDVFQKTKRDVKLTEESPRQVSESFPYANKKMQIERILEKEYAKTKFPFTILRPGFTYSEGWSPLLTCFGGQSYHLDRILKGKPLILHDGGRMLWNCSHSEDVARAFVGAIGNSRTIARMYNVTGDGSFSWEDMHVIAAKILNCESQKFISIPTEELAKIAPEHSQWCVENFQYNSLFDSSSAKKELNYRYTISFKTGANRCIDYLLNKNAIENESDYSFYDKVIGRWEEISGLKFLSSHA